MSNPRYPEEFKIQAVNQVTEKKLPVADVAARLGESTHSCWRQRRIDPVAEISLTRADSLRTTTFTGFVLT